MGTVVYLSLIWFATFPKLPNPWNTAALRAWFDDAAYGRGEGGTNLEFLDLDYVIENTTAWDYTLPADSTFLLLHQGRLAASRNYKLLDSVLIPAGRRTKCTIRVPKWYATDPHVDGFVIFDSAARYEIIFPRPAAPPPGGPLASRSRPEAILDRVSPISR